MNKKSIFAILLSVVVVVCFVAADVQTVDQYEKGIKTAFDQAEKQVFDTDVNPDPETELCDGSGWITHGDGHRTKCPGCKNCNSGEPTAGTACSGSSRIVIRRRLWTFPILSRLLRR